MSDEDRKAAERAIEIAERLIALIAGACQEALEAWERAPSKVSSSVLGTVGGIMYAAEAIADGKSNTEVRFAVKRWQEEVRRMMPSDEWNTVSELRKKQQISDAADHTLKARDKKGLN